MNEGLYGKRIVGVSSKLCLCGCGCGQYTKKRGGIYNRFLKKHENIGRTAWNKGRPFSLESRKKMSIARLGKEPANKVSVDLNKIQVPLFNKFVVDAFFPKQNLILEVLGDFWHKYPKRALRDKLRKEFLQGRGYQIEEIWEHDIKQNGVGPVMDKFIEKYKL